MPPTPRLALLVWCAGWARVLALQVFTPADFVIRRQVGQLGVATETEWQYYGGARNKLDASQPSRTVEVSGVSVRLFEGEIAGGERVLLKEYLGAAQSIGENELIITRHLYDRNAEAAAASNGSLRPPTELAAMVGHMRSDRAFEARAFRDQWAVQLPNTPAPEAGNLWLVFRWQGLQTVSAFPKAEQARAFWDVTGGNALKCRKRYLRAIVAGALNAIGWMHTRGVVHRSLGASSLLLNTLDQQKANSLSVKLIDLGFAATAAMLSEEEVKSAMRRGATSPTDILPLLALNDLHGLAYVLLELILTSLGPSETGPRLELQALKRLVEDVFEDDVLGGFREYCAEEPAYADALSFLDECDRGGWRLLQRLVDCHNPQGELARTSAPELLRADWLQEWLLVDA